MLSMTWHPGASFPQETLNDPAPMPQMTMRPSGRATAEARRSESSLPTKSNTASTPRPPVIFCSEGEARVVVRRETYEDLTSRDV